jgi:hypothetical protein
MEAKIQDIWFFNPQRLPLTPAEYAGGIIAELAAQNSAIQTS